MEDYLHLPLKEVLAAMQNRIVYQSTYFGVRTLKSPLDFWIYQEILFETKPDCIVEIGNFAGGSALALAHLCDCLGKGNIIGVDVSHKRVPDMVRKHPRITLIEGDACASFSRVKARISSSDRVLVIEDSAHTFENTLKVLQTYSPLVKAGGYFIVEDGICHHGLDLGPDPGPYEAVEAFLKSSRDFELDRSKEAFTITWNPKGYLKRIR
jgi:cephalosporin hydroxylase